VANPPVVDGRSLTLKSFLLTAGLVAVLCYFMPVWMLFRHSSGNGGGYLPLFALGAVLLVILLGPVLRGVGLAFTGGEKLFIFAGVALALFCFRTTAFLITLLPSPYNFATKENNFEGEFLYAIPDHLVPFSDVHDEQLSWFYRGLPEKIPEHAEEDWSLAQKELPREPIPWQRWVRPLGWWLSLLAAVWFAQFCLGAILRKQWLEHEALIVPQAEVLVSLVEEGPGPTGASLVPLSRWPHIFSSRAFWIGAGVSLAIFTLEGFHTYFPAVPNLGLNTLTLAPYLTEPPWNAMPPELTIQPYLLGIAYLLPAQLSLSLWFFAVIDSLTRVLLTATGQTQTVIEAWSSGGTNTGSDAVGAVTVFVVVLFWSARRHLWAVVRKALWNDRTVDDSGEFLSYRVAFFGLIASAGFITFWALRAGMSLLVTLFLFGFFFLSVIFVARVVCECGVMTAGIGYLVPYLRFVHVVGYQPWMLRSFAIDSFIWPTMMTEIQPLPLYLTAARVAERCPTGGGRLRSRWPMGAALLFLLLLAAVIISLRTIQVSYLRGGLNGPAGYYNETIWLFNNVLIRDVIIKERAHSPDPTELGAMLGGGLIMTFLLVMRQLFYWWPLHPIGYVAAGLWRGVWFSFFLGWLVKRSVLKYGGGALFHRATPVVIGLVAGQFFSGMVWFVVGLIHGQLSYGAV
jgi:uncharacterized integral membrane protein